MPEPVLLVRVDDLARAYDFGPSHPLRPERVLLTYERIEQLGLTERPGVFQEPARVATDAEIAAVHDPEYIAVVAGIDDGSVRPGAGFIYGLGTSDDPIFAGMHAASAAVCGASLTAADAVVSGRAAHAFNPAGGLHHARRAEASGFCIYNDPAVAIASILAAKPDWRVVYLDVDVHHGDGVQWIFYDEPRVATISLHQSGRYLYPGTGEVEERGRGDAVGTAINVPLEPGTGNDDYLWALERVLGEVCRAFAPDVLVTQLGGDTHHGDPLANLGLTMAAYPVMARVIHDVAHEHCSGRWVATGGGGYQAETVVPKIWTIHFAEMCSAADAIPADYLADADPDAVSRPFRDTVERRVETVLTENLDALAALAGH